ncbi:hypothetical protein KSC_018220 [Ktedonobacter sp. SOSP1-52]|nr:hypothetical protein KSC_018220 [Ktedonobacter sp. SOSP1-52]
MFYQLLFAHSTLPSLLVSLKRLNTFKAMCREPKKRGSFAKRATLMHLEKLLVAFG